MKQNLEKVTVRLFSGQRAALIKMYPHISYNEVIRSIIAAHIKQAKQRNQQQLRFPVERPKR